MENMDLERGRGACRLAPRATVPPPTGREQRKERGGDREQEVVAKRVVGGEGEESLRWEGSSQHGERRWLPTERLERHRR